MYLRLFVGFFVGWVTWIGIWIAKDFHGGLEVFAQPILAAIFSIVFVGISYLLGAPLRKTALQAVWSRFGYGSVLLTGVGLACMLFPERLGITHEAIHPETGRPFQAMDVFAAAFAYLLVIFPIVNWPRRVE